MFDRKLITVALLSFATMLAIRLIFKESTPAQQRTVQLAGQSVAAPAQSEAYRLPTQQDLMQPANRDVAFSQSAGGEMLTTVDLPHYQATFTTRGGTLQTLRYPEHRNVRNEPMQVVHAVDDAHKAQAPFLVALNDQTPYDYSFAGQERTENGVAVSYVAQSDGWRIAKTFLLHNDSYQIDVTLGFTPERSNVAPIKPRLLVPSPELPSLKRDRSNGVISNENQTGLKQAVGASALSQAWVMPTLFGAENSYFAHVLLKDSRAFAQRGYFKQVGPERMTAILEGPELDEAVSFPMSFYVGPKSLPALRAVDSRLEDLLSFGWLSVLAKMLLRFLQLINQHVGNYGLAIIILTILLKLLLLPFSLKSASYMAIQQKLAPRMTALRKKYANDQVMLQQEMMRLYKEHNVSAMAPALGCLLALPQIPIFFALYRMLSGSIELYQAPFFGWITDLSLKDPYYILPAIVGVLAFTQPFGMAQQTKDSRAQLMSYLFPAILVAMFVGLPAGLLLFILFNFLFTLGEKKLRELFA